MKARDIIPGWPRGRSTTVSYDNRQWEFLEWVWPGLETERSLRDLRRDAAYHRKQQEMVNRFFEEWRVPRKPYKPPMIRVDLNSGRNIGGLTWLKTYYETPS